MNPVIVTLLSGAGFLILFIIGELMYHHFGVRAEYTRKFAHITVGILALTFPAYFISHWQVLALSLVFFVLLLAAKKYNYLQHIHAVPRVTYGSYLYPPAVYGCFILGNKMGFGQFFYIPILVMAVSDPIAAVSGIKWGKPIIKKRNSKTFFGSLMFLVSAILATLILRFSIPGISLHSLLLVSFFVGLVGMFAEVFSYRGLDNFTIPLSIVLLMFVLRYLEVI